jgi:hypothetical protein
MTVWTEHPQILDPVVITYAVDVVDLNGNGLAPPFINAAYRATIHKYTSSDQVALDDRSARLPEDAFQWQAPDPRHQIAAPDSLRPGNGAEAECFRALPVRVAAVVKRLNGFPIVALTRVMIRLSRHVDAKIAAFDRLDPRRVCDAETLVTRFESVAGIDVRLDPSPVKMLSPTHERMFV